MAIDHGLTIMLFALLGLAFGSAANVVIARLPHWLDHRFRTIPQGHGAPSGPRSQCPICLQPLTVSELVPILSYVRQRGRCRHCDATISWRYPLVELMGAAWFVMCLWHAPTTPLIALMWGLWGIVLLVMAWVDATTYWLPDVLTLPFLGAGLALSAFGATHISWRDSLIGAGLGWGVLAIVGWFYRWRTQRIGLGVGDMKLLAGFGAWLGWIPLPWLLLFASLTGAIFGVLTLARFRRKKGGEVPIPFGPFLALAALLVLLYRWGTFGSQ